MPWRLRSPRVLLVLEQWGSNALATTLTTRSTGAWAVWQQCLFDYANPTNSTLQCEQCGSNAFSITPTPPILHCSLSSVAAMPGWLRPTPPILHCTLSSVGDYVHTTFYCCLSSVAAILSFLSFSQLTKTVYNTYVDWSKAHLWKQILSGWRHNPWAPKYQVNAC